MPAQWPYRPAKLFSRSVLMKRPIPYQNSAPAVEPIVPQMTTRIG
jgi:hypothetical protein